MAGLASTGLRSWGLRNSMTDLDSALALVPGGIWWDCTRLSPDGQTLYDSTGLYPATLGSTPGADTNDPTPSAQGLVCAGDDYVTLPAFPEPWTLILAFDFGPPGQYMTQATFCAINADGTSPSGIGIDFLPGESTSVYVGHIGYARSVDALSIPDRHGIVALGHSGDTTTLRLCSAPETFISLTAAHSGTPTQSRVGAGNLELATYLTASAVGVYPSLLTGAQLAQNHAYLKAWGLPKGIVL